MGIDRREFIKLLGLGVLGFSSAASVPACAENALAASHFRKFEKDKIGIKIDKDRIKGDPKEKEINPESFGDYLKKEGGNIASVVGGVYELYKRQIIPLLPQDTNAWDLEARIGSENFGFAPQAALQDRLNLATPFGIVIAEEAISGLSRADTLPIVLTSMASDRPTGSIMSRADNMVNMQHFPLDFTDSFYHGVSMVLPKQDGGWVSVPFNSAVEGVLRRAIMEGKNTKQLIAVNLNLPEDVRFVQTVFNSEGLTYGELMNYYITSNPPRLADRLCGERFRQAHLTDKMLENEKMVYIAQLDALTAIVRIGGLTAAQALGEWETMSWKKN